MDISKLTTITLKDCVGYWLDEKVKLAERLRDRALDFKNQDCSPENVKRFRYHQHAVKAMRWLRAQLPERFADVVLYNQMDDAEISDFISAMVMGEKAWRF